MDGDADNVTIGFSFSITDPPSIAAVELSLFTCPSSVTSNISLHSSRRPGPFVFSRDSVALLASVMNIPCSSAQNVTLCVEPPATGDQFYFLEFTNPDIEVAEVQFFNDTLVDITSSPLPLLATTSVFSPPSLGIVVNTPVSTPTLSMSPRGSPCPSVDDKPSTGLIVGVAIAAVVALIAIILAMFIICYLMSIRRKQQESQVEKLQSAMLEHKSIELTSYKETDQDMIHIQRYDKVAIVQQTVKSDQSTIPLEPSKSIDNSDYANMQQKAPLAKQFSDISSPAYSTIAATSANDEPSPKVQPAFSAIPNFTPPDLASSPEVYAEVQSKKTVGEQVVDQPQQVYSVVQKEAPHSIPEKSGELVEYLATRSTKHQIDSNEYSTLPVQSEQATHQRPNLATLSKPAFDGMLINSSYKSLNTLSQGPTSDIIYAEPGTSNQQATPILYDTVYSEPIKPSLFTSEGSDAGTMEELHPYAPIYTVPKTTPQSDDNLLKVTSENIREVRLLGRGQFGQVVLAETIGLSLKDLKVSHSDANNKSILVAVKKLRPTASKSVQQAFEKECRFMGRLKDMNVTQILAVCKEHTPFIVMEYMENGDLNQYLQRYDSVTLISETSDDRQVTTDTLLYMTTQIASAMKYLACHNFVHRDLATRNCLVGQNHLVKIADFGMSRNLYESHYYRIHGQAILPVRWMATECFYGKFSQTTDIWAFGVTVWEIFSLAKEPPLKDLSDQEIVQDAIKGENRKLLDKPEACPPDVYKIMLKCWAGEPSQRASFEELYGLLSAINKVLQ